MPRGGVVLRAPAAHSVSEHGGIQNDDRTPRPALESAKVEIASLPSVARNDSASLLKLIPSHNRIITVSFT